MPTALETVIAVILVIEMFLSSPQSQESIMSTA